MTSLYDINARDVITRPEDMAAAPDNKSEPNLATVVDNAMSNYFRGQQYIIISDNHFVSDQNLDFAIEISKRTGKPLALEIINPSAQPFLDALSAGIITREEFMDYCEDIKIFPEGSEPNYDHPQSYMGIKRGADFYKKILDAIEQGVKVFGIGSIKSGRNDFTEQDDELLQSMCNLYERINLETLISMKKAGRAISKQSLLEESKRHPDYEQFVSGKKKLEQWLAKVTNQDKNENIYFDIALRVNGDKAVSQLLEQMRTKNPSGAVILYGASHTLHNENGGDIDGNLRNQGQSVLILDPVNKNWQPYCETTLFIANKKYCDEVLTQAENSVHQRARLLGDPDRFSVDFNTNTIVPVNEQSDWGRRIMNLLVP